MHEGSGLALSSRNRYLSDEQREQALGLSRALCAMRSAAASGTAEVAELRDVASDVLSAHDLRVDYVDVVASMHFALRSGIPDEVCLATIATCAFWAT